MISMDMEATSVLNVSISMESGAVPSGFFWEGGMEKISQSSTGSEISIFA